MLVVITDDSKCVSMNSLLTKAINQSGGDAMSLFLITFAVIAVVITLMAIGVIFGRQAIKGSCGGSGGAECVCTEKCDKRKKLEAAQSLK